MIWNRQRLILRGVWRKTHRRTPVSLLREEEQSLHVGKELKSFELSSTIEKRMPAKAQHHMQEPRIVLRPSTIGSCQPHPAPSRTPAAALHSDQKTSPIVVGRTNMNVERSSKLRNEMDLCSEISSVEAKELAKG
jgi:hypothetical protein